MEEIGSYGDYCEKGRQLCEGLVSEVLKAVPEATPERLGFAFYEYVHFGRFEDAFAEAAGYMWQRKKRFPDKMLDDWDAFLFDPGDDCDIYDKPFKIARRRLEAQRALPKE